MRISSTSVKSSRISEARNFFDEIKAGRFYTAKRLRPPAQRCRSAATLGIGMKEGATPSGLRRIGNSVTQGSRGGNPGLKDATALR